MAKRSKRTSKSTSKRKSKADSNGSLFDAVDDHLLTAIPLRQAAQVRYLNYSLSVITSRALPDVRDGLKPVQRRILYTMSQQGLTATAKHRKCAKVVGDVMGNYHPHGDSSIYEALVRMAQPFSLRMPLIDGSGNFGSVDGDNAAAMRYTECRMTPIASEVLADLATRTVAFKPNYDGSREEPVVLPSRVPNLLVNGATGIAVGMATNIPPHNLKEVCQALLKLLRDPEIKDYQLVANDAVQGPDFPTGGQIINTKEELREIYSIGQGTIKLRGTVKLNAKSRSGKVLQVDSIPFGVNKSALVERINELVYSGKLPLVVEARDLSTDEIRIDLLLKKDADENKVLAYLYKHTDFQKNFNVNLTCLVPTENPEVGAPNRLGLKEILWHFLHFRLSVLTKRLENELASLERRIHILEGFALIFDALDEIIRIIRKSEGKADAAEKIMQRFPAAKGGLDAEQTDAILELKLYRLARLEINMILDELKEKRKRAGEIKKLLADDTKDYGASGRWKIIRTEIESLISDYSKDLRAKRQSIIDTVAEEPEYTAEDFIVAEDCHIMVTKDGWVKRQKQIADPGKSRLRQGDEVLACVAGSTRESIGLFSSLGVCYTARMIDIPASTGFGEPIQKLFKLKDGERIVAALSFDPRIISDIKEDPKKPNLCPETHALAVTSNGFALRFGLEGFSEPSTRAGRRFARVKPGASVIDVAAVHGTEVILAVTENCRAMICSAEDVNYLSGPGKGVTLIRITADDRVLGFKPSSGDRDLMTVQTNRGAKKTISTAKYRITSRGGRGNEIQKNGKIAEIIVPPIAAPETFED
ncbi:DNA gyrase/topoisomerase IV subunit A [Novipirellula artificiosorum]|uniref:DNA topoisomerase (ATP-hydrolyzing) n=1 Tax=Novipirellula artificiosorum TaxID=2528016 RepID=A0A5C6DK00_9BACT|nr:DNA topoisomerase (ATP-hydrolyzing) [Novipirellula artificiosorum]TWU35921.1 DNA gyrase subunit A [Novipirellula artificiosorum]